jgi:hypothetical protein
MAVTGLVSGWEQHFERTTKSERRFWHALYLKGTIVYRRDRVGPVGARLAHPIYVLTKVSPGMILTHNVARTRVLKAACTLRLEQGEPGAEFTVLGSLERR